MLSCKYREASFLKPTDSHTACDEHKNSNMYGFRVVLKPHLELLQLL